jgi:hypothetical protein
MADIGQIKNPSMHSYLLRQVIADLEALILATPIGQARNLLCDANIDVLTAHSLLHPKQSARKALDTPPDICDTSNSGKSAGE